MPLDLLSFDPTKPDLAKMYAWATCLRLFKSTTDGRGQFWLQVPGVVGVHSRASILANNFNSSDVLLSHYLVELNDGWLNVLGGTEFPLGWPYHAWSLVEVPRPSNDYFPLYWRAVAEACLADIDLVIPSSDARPICFLGHSLGGASSVCAAYRDFARSVSRRRTVVTFGSPFVRSRDGMDGREFDHCRVLAEEDPVPCLPQHLVKFGLSSAVPFFKIPLFSLYHHGTAITINQHGIREVGDYNFLKYTTLGLAYTLAVSSLTGWIPGVPHFMTSYCMFLRLALQLYQVPFDPLWDKINAYCNIADGSEWNINSFPAAMPPPQVTTPPPAVNLGQLIASAPDPRPYNTNLLGGRPGVPVLRDQSLVDHLNTTTGLNLANVTVHLAQVPVSDPLNVSIESFTECDFGGYTPIGGSFWVTPAPQAWTTARRFSGRAVFACNGQAPTNFVHHWYVMGHQQPGDLPILLDWGFFTNPMAMDRPRCLALELTFMGGPA